MGGSETGEDTFGRVQHMASRKQKRKEWDVKQSFSICSSYSAMLLSLSAPPGDEYSPPEYSSDFPSVSIVFYWESRLYERRRE